MVGWMLKQSILKEAVTVQSWYYHGICLDEPMKTISYDASVLGETQTEHLLNTNQEYYHC
jgi:hypothetical protein